MVLGHKIHRLQRTCHKQERSAFLAGLLDGGNALPTVLFFIKTGNPKAGLMDNDIQKTARNRSRSLKGSKNGFS